MNTHHSVGQAIRNFRARENLSLEDLADSVKRITRSRPSPAKLSRIETGKQPVSTDLIQPLAKITGIPAKELRPDLAALVKDCV